MFGVFSFRTAVLRKFLNDEIRFLYISSFLNISQTHRSNRAHRLACKVNHFTTCKQLFRNNEEDIEKFNPTKMIIKKDGSVKKKKKATGVKVYILNEKGISSTMNLSEAQKLAQHQGLELKQVEKINGINAYKLVSSADETVSLKMVFWKSGFNKLVRPKLFQYFPIEPQSLFLISETPSYMFLHLLHSNLYLFSDLFDSEFQLKNNEKKKEEKIKKLIISADIKPHDLQIKIKHINRFLDKGMKVYIKLGEQDNELSKLGAIYSELENAVVGHSISKNVSKSKYHVTIVPKEKDINNDKKKQ